MTPPQTEAELRQLIDRLADPDEMARWLGLMESRGARIKEGAHRRWLHEYNLPDCQGRGWVFNRKPDAIPDAVKAKGWPWETSRHTLEGIAVDIYDGFNTLGEVTADEGITSRYHA